MKIFAVSDIHSYFDEFISELNKSGFEQNNNKHLLVICGDCFDRGTQSKELLNYLMSTNNKVIVKGNHDILFEEMCHRGYPLSHDKHNGTIDTAVQLGHVKDTVYEPDTILELAYMKTESYRKQLVNYFETKNYIFVHGFIPLDYDHSDNTFTYASGVRTNDKKYNPNWRYGDWADAIWLNGMDNAKFNKTGKTIICGHYHCSWGWARDICRNSPEIDKEEAEFGKTAVWEPYEDFENHLIAIDRCTAYTGKVNVLVLEDELIDE